MRTKTERGNRVFPVSDHSSDVIAALASKLREYGVKIYLNEEVGEILYSSPEQERETVKAQENETAGAQESGSKPASRDSGRTVIRNDVQRLNAALEGWSVAGLSLRSGKSIPCDAVIVATGGLSYPSTGSTGDGYRFARAAGLGVTECSPSLVPMETAGDLAQQLQGLSLRNVEVSILDGKKLLYREFGEMMFTHFGVTGPLILTASSRIQKKLAEHPLKLQIDLKPALDEEQVDARILREFEAAKNRQLKTVLGTLFPAKLIPVMICLCEIPAEKPVHEITREERRKLIVNTKHFPLTLTGLRGYNEAVITRGGVDVKEIDPSTMESRKIHGLYFAGEVLDLDAVTGGFNLQIAWATGYAAGMGIPGAGPL